VKAQRNKELVMFECADQVSCYANGRNGLSKKFFGLK
jgi:hypothetical protein